MKSLLILFTLISFSFGQYSEMFNDFTGHLNDSTKAKFVFGSGYTGGAGSIGNDQSGNGNDLTASGGFDYASQLTGTSPIYENDNALVFDGLDDYWYIPAAQAGDLNPGDGNCTVKAWVKTTYTAGYKGIVKKQTTTAGQGNYQLYIRSGGLLRSTLNIVGGAVVNCDGGNIATGNWTHVVLVINQTTDIMYLYVNGIEVDQANISTIGTITNSGNINIGTKYDAGGEYWNGEISSITYHAKALTADEIEEQYELAYGWYSENTIVIRDTMDWYQGFADTIYTSTGIVGRSKMRFNAWGQNGGETLKVWSGTTSKSFTLTDTKKPYSANLQMADGLYFASTDTVYIDDIKSGKAQKGYLQYLQYNDYIGSGNCKEGTGSFPYYFNMFLN